MLYGQMSLAKNWRFAPKRDVMRNFWRDTICRFEWTRPMIDPRYRGQVLGAGIGVSITSRYWGQPIRGLVYSKRQFMSLHFAWHSAFDSSYRGLAICVDLKMLAVVKEKNNIYWQYLIFSLSRPTIIITASRSNQKIPEIVIRGSTHGGVWT